MDGLWETAQGVGAIVGLITGGFVFWEHLFRHAPQSFVIGKPYREGGTTFAHLRIINLSPRPVVIRWRRGLVDHRFSIKRDASTRSVVEGIIEGGAMFIINGSETADLPLMNPPNFSQISPVGSIELEFTWQFAQPVFYKKQRSVKMSIEKRVFLTMIDMGDELEDESAVDSKP